MAEPDNTAGVEGQAAYRDAADGAAESAGPDADDGASAEKPRRRLVAELLEVHQEKSTLPGETDHDQGPVLDEEPFEAVEAVYELGSEAAPEPPSIAEPAPADVPAAAAPAAGEAPREDAAGVEVVLPDEPAGLSLSPGPVVSPVDVEPSPTAAFAAVVGGASPPAAETQDEPHVEVVVEPGPSDGVIEITSPPEVSEHAEPVPISPTPEEPLVEWNATPLSDAPAIEMDVEADPDPVVELDLDGPANTTGVEPPAEAGPGAVVEVVVDALEPAATDEAAAAAPAQVDDPQLEPLVDELSSILVDPSPPAEDASDTPGPMTGATEGVEAAFREPFAGEAQILDTPSAPDPPESIGVTISGAAGADDVSAAETPGADIDEPTATDEAPAPTLETSEAATAAFEPVEPPAIPAAAVEVGAEQEQDGAEDGVAPAGSVAAEPPSEPSDAPAVFLSETPAVHNAVKWLIAERDRQVMAAERDGVSAYELATSIDAFVDAVIRTVREHDDD